MKYCPECGSPVELRQLEDDHRERHVCTVCGAVHYHNPKRRAIEPRHGLWTLPAGFMENGETTLEGAARETLEEANARVEIGDLYALYNIPHIDQVQLLFRAKLLDLDFSPGMESLEVKLFEASDIPWDELAFRAVRITLQDYVADRRSGNFPFRIVSLGPPPA
jgi:ADP-ribose pyrophosphatase YjhB (NUDIX family)